MKTMDFAYHLSRYLGCYLAGQRNFSANTVAAYRDAFKLLLKYFRDKKGITPDKLRIADFNKAIVLEYLDWLKNERSCGRSTLQQRLTILRSFFAYLQAEAPEHIMLCQNILRLESDRKTTVPPMNYLSFEAIKAILALPNQHVRQGRRDLVLLTLLYDSGARVQELADLRVRDLRLASPSGVNIFGKGSKWRFVPLMTKTAELLGEYLNENKLNVPEAHERQLFTNKYGHKLTRVGIAYIVDKYVTEAKNANPTLCFGTVTPHTFRHSKAMHLLQAGVDLVYIRDILGHSNIKTTEHYARTDFDAKRKILESVYQSPLPESRPSWTEDETLMQILQGLV